MFHAAALSCGLGLAVTQAGRAVSASCRAPRAGVVARAAASDGARSPEKPKKESVGVFNVSTSKLPGGDKLTNEGILGFFIGGFLALWLAVTGVRTFAVMIGFVFTSAKYFAMGVALLLIGVAVS